MLSSVVSECFVFVCCYYYYLKSKHSFANAIIFSIQHVAVTFTIAVMQTQKE